MTSAAANERPNPAPAAAGTPPTGSLAKRLLARAIGLDLRSLALLRIGLAIVVLLDLAVRATDLLSHYSDDGVLPRVALLENLPDRWHFSLHLLSGTVYSQAALFTLAALAAALLGIGLYTGPAAFACWLLTVSLQNRNPFVLSGADVLLRMALLWAMFLPLSAKFSCDRLRRGSTASAASEPSTVSIGTAAYTLQIISVYLFAGLIKLDTPAWNDGTGLAYALRAPAFATALGAKLGNEVVLLQWGTRIVPYFELVVPLLLLVPVATQGLRLACVLTFWVFHAAIGLTLDVGTYVLVGVVGWSALLPAWFWDRVAPVVRQGLPARLRRALDASGARIASTARALVPAVAGIATPPAWLPMIPWLRRCRAVLCAGLLSYVLAWNVHSFRNPPLVSMPEGVRWIGALLRVDQRWDMFSEPITSGGWFVIPARLHSGAERELFSQAERVSWDRPRVVASTFRSDRWRKYMLNFASPKKEHLRMPFGRSLCRRSAAVDPPDTRLEAFKIYLMQYPVRPWDRAPPRPHKVLLWRHECKDGLLQRWDRLL